MRAAVVDRYGPPDVVDVRDVPQRAPRAGQVRVRVRAASLNPLDSKLRSGALRPFLRLSFPAILGFDFAGEIESLGPGVGDWRVGERAYGRTDAKTGGTHAELAVVAARVIDRIPENLSYEQAASLPLTAMTAIQALGEVAGLETGQRLLINGAAGGVGVAAVQAGRAAGARVTAVCRGASAPLVTRLGAERVLDYTRDELAQGDERYDVVFDAAGTLAPRAIPRLLGRRGTYLTTGFSPGLALRSVLGRLWSRRRIVFLVTRADGPRMRTLSGLVATGRLEAVIDSVWPLARIREAYERLERGHPQGKVVVSVTG